MADNKISTEDVQSKKRYIQLFGEINENSSKEFVNNLLKLELENPSQDILVIVNSPGGSIDSLWSLVDCMNLCRCKIHTLCIGKAMSAAAIVLMSGAKGCRYGTPNSRIMLHKIQTLQSGGFDDIKNSMKELERLQKQFSGYVTSRTKIKPAEVDSLLERELYLSVQESVKFGVIDKVVSSFNDIDIKKW